MDLPKTVHLQFQHPKTLWNSFLGVMLGEDHFDELIDYDSDVYTPEGALLFKFRKKCLDAGAAKAAFPVLRKISQKSMNRGLATGKHVPKFATKSDGTLSTTNAVPSEYGVNSAIIGYFDRYPRTPYCRQTAFTANEPEKWKKVLPFLQSVGVEYEKMSPDRWAAQMSWIKGASKDFVIRNTPFTTVTVNRNWQTACHTDQGDLKIGLSCITALRGGEFKGGYLVFPHYRIAVDLGTCDLLAFDSHHIHGNTPIYGKVNQYERVSLVLYARERMIDCGTAEQELERVKNRKPGDKL